MHEMQILFFMVTAMVVFFAPTWIAPAGRRWSVGLVNVFFGLTLIGWGIALIMAVRAREQVAK